MKIRNKEFDMKSPDVYIMGILNITPDSFSDGGRYVERDDILSHAEEMISAGADIIDIGGESTRPGYQPVTEQEEIERVCNAIDVIRGEFDVPISVDTYKAAVMDQCLKAGADIANDIWGLRYDLFNPSGINHASLPSQMAEVVKKYDVPVVVMHNDNMTRSLEERASSGIIEEYAKICGVSMDEAADLLKRAGYALSESRLGDMIVKFFLEMKRYNIDEINEALYTHDCKTLTNWRGNK